MPKVNAPITTFNGGIVSRLALARVDVQRMRFAAEEQTNWLPRTIGPMMLRTGLAYVDTSVDNLKTYPVPFIFSHDSQAMIEISDGALHVRVDEVLIARQTVATTVGNGDFTYPDSSWTQENNPAFDDYSGGARSSIGYEPLSSVADGTLVLYARGRGSKSKAWQAITVAGGDQAIEHALRIVVSIGPVGFRIGSVQGRDDIVELRALETGNHSVAFTPNTGTVYIQFESTPLQIEIVVQVCQFESAGPMTLPIPWAADELATLSTAESGEVIYVAAQGHQSRKIQRWAARSWSIVQYQPPDGPFRVNRSSNVSLTPENQFGVSRLTATGPFFKDSMVGSLIRLFEGRQTSEDQFSDQGQFSQPIRVSGISSTTETNPDTVGTRQFMVQLRGTWSGTVTLQRSTAGPDLGFSDVKSWSANVEEWFDDHMDNSIIWYRLGIKAGEYGSGTVLFLIAYPFGGGPGVVRVRNLESDTSAIIEVLETLAARDGTDDWQEGEWSNKYAYPSAVTLYEGRLFWLGKDRIWGSISDAYESFDIDLKGDAGPINRSIGYGPVEVINWGLPLQRLILGMQASEAAVRSTTFDQPLSPTNFSIKDISTQGSARVAAVKVDTRGVFVQASLRRIYQLVFNIEEADYNATDLTALLPDLDSNFTQLVVQRQPDTRIHCLRADGTVLLLTYEAKEEVLCWTKTETNGIVERMAVLPGDAEDKVYYYIARTVGGSTVRFVERFALITECQGGTLSKQLDSHVVISQSSSTTITGLSRLEGETVAVWANGKDLGLHTVASGAVTVSEAVTSAIVGLTYTATFKSAKLAYGSAAGTSLTQRKRIDHLGLILHNTHAQGLEAGQDFDTMDNLPLMYQGAAVDTNRVYDEFDEPMIILPGKWNTDARLCLRATAPRPVTLLGAVISVAANDTA